MLTSPIAASISDGLKKRDASVSLNITTLFCEFTNSESLVCNKPFLSSWSESKQIAPFIFEAK